MPAVPLYRRLLEKCNGRVARADIGLAAKPAPNNQTEKAFKDIATNDEWHGWSQAQQQAEGSGMLEVTDECIIYRLA